MTHRDVHNPILFEISWEVANKGIYKNISKDELNELNFS